MLSDENIERIFTSDYESLDKIAEQMITKPIWQVVMIISN